MHLVEVRRSPVHGWGVFARRRIGAGVVVETAPYLPIPLDQWEAAPSIARYVFDLDGHHVALCLGTVSLYNHSKRPNAVVWFDTDDGLAYVETLAVVAGGQELFISYGDEGLESWGIEPT